MEKKWLTVGSNWQIVSVSLLIPLRWYMRSVMLNIYSLSCIENCVCLLEPSRNKTFGQTPSIHTKISSPKPWFFFPKLAAAHFWSHTYSNDVESNLNRETAERILNSGKVNHHCLVSQGRQANSSERQMAHSSIGVQISSANTQAEWGLKGWGSVIGQPWDGATWKQPSPCPEHKKNPQTASQAELSRNPDPLKPSPRSVQTHLRHSFQKPAQNPIPSVSHPSADPQN